MKRITEDGEILDTVTHETIAMAPPFFKTPFNHDRDNESLSTALECKDPSRTKQEFAKDADINVILAKFLQTGQIEGRPGAPTFGDAEETFDLQTAMVTSYEVEQAWEALPAKVRNTLRDPKTFADYITHCMQTGDLQPLRDLGLANPAPPEPAITPGGAPATPSPDGPPGGPIT